MSQSTIFQSCWDDFLSSWVEPILLIADKVVCSKTQHSESGESQTNNPYALPTLRNQFVVHIETSPLHSFYPAFGFLCLVLVLLCICSTESWLLYINYFSCCFGLVWGFTSQSTAMVMSRWSIHLTTLFPWQAWLRPNKKISVFRVTGLKILGRVEAHICFFSYFFFWKKNIILCILKGIAPFKCIKLYFFPKNW